MSEGPFGGPRPFVSNPCRVVIMRSVEHENSPSGADFDVSPQEKIQLIDDIASKTGASQGDVYLQEDTKMINSRVVDVLRVTVAFDSLSDGAAGRAMDGIQEAAEKYNGNCVYRGIGAGDPEAIARTGNLR